MKIEVNQKRKLSGGKESHNLEIDDDMTAFYKNLRCQKNFTQIEEESPGHDESGQTDCVDTEQMYLVFDTEEGRLIDVRDLEQEFFAIDSTTYLDKRHGQKFTTISIKSKARSLWQEFWQKKDKTNTKLIKAAQKGDLKSIQKLLNHLREAEKIADINFCDDEGMSALHVAAKCNQYDAMQLILYTGEADVNMPTNNEDMMTSLHLATIEQHLLIVKMLLQEFKAEIDCLDSQSNTPLHYAIMVGNIKLVKIILAKFPRIDIQNIEGQTALSLQMRIDLKLVRLIKLFRLISIGASIILVQVTEKDRAGVNESSIEQ